MKIEVRIIPDELDTRASLSHDGVSWDKAKAGIQPRLVSRKNNKEFLSAVPHRDFLDLAVTYTLPRPSTTVSNELMKEWGVDEPDLYAAAIKNAGAIQLVERDLREYIGEILHCEIDEPDNDNPGVVIIKADVGDNGATCALLCGKHRLRDFAAKHRSDVFIIPSSVYEILIIPASDDIRASFLLETLRKINETEVTPDDRLSDNLYIYRRATDEIEVIEEE